MGSNDNLDISEALGLKKIRDAQSEFSETIDKFMARGLDIDVIARCMATSLVGRTALQYEQMDYPELAEAMSRVMFARGTLHDIYMNLRDELGKFTFEQEN